ncbi:hypothetical protein L596_005491 [Steinernema carpocapsae]|uniref:Kinase n=1 Tax=Steinernema carpocapsae TaxID=34508 RepID=A0A4U8UZF7_STECR|nr:hypothetical protein L596_005491 [Steinernema carpocapsae]
MAREEEQVPMEQLPTAYEWFEDQIAGHHQSIVKNGERQIGFLKELSGNLILKLVQDGVRGECEPRNRVVQKKYANAGFRRKFELRKHVSTLRIARWKPVDFSLAPPSVSSLDFLSSSIRPLRTHALQVQVYTRLAELRNHSTVEEESGSSDNNEIIIRKLAPLVPEFHGLTTVCLGNKDREFLKLEDITGHFRQPCIMDIKMGKVTYDPLATAEKAVREMSKYPEQKKLGFRILGYRLHQEGAEVKVANKKWGLSWTSDNIEEDLANPNLLLNGRCKPDGLVVSW